MDHSMTYLETGSVDPYYNLAFEEYVLANRTEGDYLMLWQNDNTIVIGQNQNTEAEINRDYVEKHKINVVRRSTGGGAVYHDLGNLNYSFITDIGPMQELSMRRFTTPVVSALQSLGLNCEASGRNDILVEGRKVSGTAQRILGNRILHHGTLLFDSNPTAIAGALRIDTDKFQGKSVKSVQSRIGNIRDFLKNDMTLSEFWAYLKTVFAGDKMICGIISPEEQVQIEKLRNEKYCTWEWNFGRSPRFNFSNKCRFEGGSLEVCADIQDGIILEIKFYGDFLSRCSLHEVQSALIGCRFEKEQISERLHCMELELFFGSITSEDILNTMFPRDN